MSSPRPLSLILAAGLLVTTGHRAAAAQEYDVLDLGADGINNQTWSVNSSGQVAGWSTFPDGHDEGYFFDGLSPLYVGTPGPTSRSDLVGVNDLGEAVGKSGTVYENGEALLRRANGSVRRLGTLGGSRSAAMAINDAGQVVGWSHLPGDAESRPFVWESGAMDSLPLLGGTQGSASWINDAGQIVGGSTTDAGGLTQFAVLWDGGKITQLPPIDSALNNIASYIHDNGDIAGSIRLRGPGGITVRAAVWRDAQVHLQLGTLADGTPAEAFASSWATAVNSSGVVVGMSVNAQSALVPFVYRRGEMAQLDTLIPGSWTGYNVGAGAINDAGQIVMSAVDPNGVTRALLLTPVVPTGVAAGTAGKGSDYDLRTRGLRILFRIPRSEPVTISLFDVRGRRIATPLGGTPAAGEHELTWDGRTQTGKVAPSGVYFVRLETPGFVASERLTLVR